jgi:hypothetical protein
LGGEGIAVCKTTERSGANFFYRSSRKTAQIFVTGEGQRPVAIHTPFPQENLANRRRGGKQSSISQTETVCGLPRRFAPRNGEGRQTAVLACCSIPSDSIPDSVS